METAMMQPIPALLADKPSVLDITANDKSRLCPWPLLTERVDFFHYHNSFELGYCYSGSGIHNTPQRSIAFEEGDALLLFPGQQHLAIKSPDTDTRWIFVYVDIEKLFLACGFDRSTALSVCRKLSYSVYDLIKRSQYPEIAEEIHSFIEIYRNFTPVRTEQLGAGFYSLLLSISNAVGTLEPVKIETHNDYGRFQPVIEMIEQQLSRGRLPAIEDLAASCYLSLPNFRKAFGQQFGMAPHKYIIYRAISNAQCMLLSTEKSILEVCMESGFQSLASFNRNFKLLSGISPESYRQLHKGV